MPKWALAQYRKDHEESGRRPILYLEPDKFYLSLERDEPEDMADDDFLPTEKHPLISSKPRPKKKPRLIVRYKQSASGSTKTLRIDEKRKGLPVEIKALLSEELSTPDGNSPPLTVTKPLEPDAKYGSRNEKFLAAIISSDKKFDEFEEEHQITVDFLREAIRFDIKKWSDRANIYYKTGNVRYSTGKNLLKVAATIVSSYVVNPPLYIKHIADSINFGPIDGDLAIASAVISLLNIANYVLRLWGLRRKRKDEFLAPLAEVVANPGSLSYDVDRLDDENEKNLSESKHALRKSRNRIRALRKFFKDDIDELKSIITDNSLLWDFLERKLTTESMQNLSSRKDLDPEWQKIIRSFADDMEDWKSQWVTRWLTLVSTCSSAASYVTRMLISHIHLAAHATSSFPIICLALTTFSLIINIGISLNRYYNIVNGKGKDGKDFRNKVCERIRLEKIQLEFEKIKTAVGQDALKDIQQDFENIQGKLGKTKETDWDNLCAKLKKLHLNKTGRTYA